jgi:hypothetical protein
VKQEDSDVKIKVEEGTTADLGDVPFASECCFDWETERSFDNLSLARLQEFRYNFEGLQKWWHCIQSMKFASCRFSAHSSTNQKQTHRVSRI